MEQRELDRLMADTCEKIRALDIPVSKRLFPEVRVNARAKRRLGCCFFQDGWYKIEVSADILEDRELLRQTLCHELLHTCPGCQDHGKIWKAYAQRLNQRFGYHIERTVKTEECPVPLRHEEVKYILECQSCGARILRKRMSKVVKTPWRYRCACGGKLKRVQS